MVSPWPDRFGRTGNRALDFFSFDKRPVRDYPWQQSPYQIRGGSNSPDDREAPLSYLSAYWLGRSLGALTPQD